MPEKYGLEKTQVEAEISLDSGNKKEGHFELSSDVIEKILKKLRT